MSDPTPAAEQEALPFRRTLRESYHAVFGNPIPFLKALCVPFVLLIAIRFVSGRLHENDMLLFSWAIQCLVIVPYTLFSFSWSRSQLVGLHAASPQVFPPLDRRYLSFLSVSIMVAVAYVGAVAAFFFLVTAVNRGSPGPYYTTVLNPYTIGWFGLFYVVLPYLVLRISFVFPATSVGASCSIARSWQLTRGYGIRIFLLALACSLPMVLAIIGRVYMRFLVFSGELAVDIFESGRVGWLFLEASGSVLTLISLGLAVSAISIAFKGLTGWVPDEAEVT